MKSETVKTKSCRVEANTFMSTDHKAVFLETHTSREEEKHTNKTNIKQRKRSPTVGVKRAKIRRTGNNESVMKEIGAQHLDRFRPIACLIPMRKLVWVLVADDNGKDHVRILPDSVRAKQPPATSIIQHLDDNRKAKAWSIPLFAAQLGLKILFGPCGQKPRTESNEKQ